MPDTPSAIVRLSHVNKSYGSFRVRKDVSLSVNAGEVLAIIGPSGSGKSTLLRAINWLEPANEGTITVGPVTLDLAKPARAADLVDLRAQLGMVFQSFNLFPHLSC